MGGRVPARGQPDPVDGRSSLQPVWMPFSRFGPDLVPPAVLLVAGAHPPWLFCPCIVPTGVKEVTGVEIELTTRGLDHPGTRAMADRFQRVGTGPPVTRLADNPLEKMEIKQHPIYERADRK